MRWLDPVRYMSRYSVYLICHCHYKQIQRDRKGQKCYCLEPHQMAWTDLNENVGVCNWDNVWSCAAVLISHSHLDLWPCLMQKECPLNERWHQHTCQHRCQCHMDWNADWRAMWHGQTHEPSKPMPVSLQYSPQNASSGKQHHTHTVVLKAALQSSTAPLAQPACLPALGLLLDRNSIKICIITDFSERHLFNSK